jgi:hypothetical protein
LAISSRDIHSSRICPIDTFEEINVRHSGSLTIHARIDHVRRKQKKKKRQHQIELNILYNSSRKFCQGIQEEQVVPARHGQEFLIIAWEQIFMLEVFFLSNIFLLEVLSFFLLSISSVKNKSRCRFPTAFPLKKNYPPDLLLRSASSSQSRTARARFPAPPLASSGHVARRRHHNLRRNLHRRPQPYRSIPRSRAPSARRGPRCSTPRRRLYGSVRPQVRRRHLVSRAPRVGARSPLCQIPGPRQRLHNGATVSVSQLSSTIPRRAVFIWVVTPRREFVQSVMF